MTEHYKLSHEISPSVSDAAKDAPEKKILNINSHFIRLPDKRPKKEDAAVP